MKAPRELTIKAAKDRMRAGKLTARVDDPLDTFGHRAVAHVPNLQSIMKFLCKNGFEHHVAMTMGNVAEVLDEAFTTYMGWENYNHSIRQDI